ncbi:MAG: SGNH/GDSL hydrolase family protein [Betaproteobacteria bacterium]
MKLSQRLHLGPVRHDVALGMLRRLRSVFVALTLIFVPFAHSSAQTIPLAFKHGDRVVWLGDSITAAYTYGRYIETFFLLRRPDLDLTFINAGIGGHSAFDGLNRLDRDVLVHRPTVVVINFGMNDAAYPSNSPHAAFIQNIQTMIRRLREGGVKRIIWVEPSPANIAGVVPPSKLIDRQKQLERLVSAMQAQTVDADVLKVQWQQPLKNALARTASSPDVKLIPDRIHPSALGHALMAIEFLKQTGANMNASVIQSSVSNHSVESQFFPAGANDRKPMTLKTALGRDKSVSVDIGTALPPVPFVLSLSQITLVASAELDALRSLVWQVNGLDAQVLYRVAVNGFAVGHFTGDELARGVDVMRVADARVPLSQQARKDLEACALRTGYVFVNDYECLYDMIVKRDLLQAATRGDRIRDLPDFAAVGKSAYLTSMQSWMDSTNAAIDARAVSIRKTPHVLSLVRAQ